jgi:hypothetical protein
VEIVVFVVVMVAIVVAGQAWSKEAKRKRALALTQAADGLMFDARVDPEQGSVSGRIGDIEVNYRLVTRGSGSSSESWTECEVKVDTEQLDIALRPESRGEKQWVAEGLAIDVVIGHEQFDAQFIVEAAPFELAKEALNDAQLRDALLGYHPIGVKPCEGGLVFEKKGWLEEPEQVARFASTAVRFAQRMKLVVAAARERDQRDAALTGYRGATAEQSRAGEMSAREETAELKALRLQREQAIKRRNTIIMVCILGVVLILFVARNL